MIEPVAKVSLLRAAIEVGTYLGVSAFALTMTTGEVAIAVSVVGGVIGGVVWLVRLEGRINTQAELLHRVDARVGRIADHMGVAE